MFALLPILLQVLPSLAGMAGANAGALVTAGAKVARDVFGTDRPEKVVEALKDPATAEAFKARLEAETAQLQADLADVQSARTNALQLAQAGSMLGYAPAVLSVLIVFGFILLTGAMLFKSVPDSNVAMVLFGTLSTAFGQVLSFWLGSSKGSRDKDALLAAVAQPPSLGQAIVKAIKK